MKLRFCHLEQFGLRFLGVFTLACLSLHAPRVQAQRAGASRDMRALDALLKGAPSGESEVVIDDMGFHARVLRAMRDRLTAGTDPAPRAASESPVTFWPGGIVYYNFAANVTTIHQKAFLDAAAEWTAWANLTFTLATGQANYVTVNDGGTSLSGGNSFVGVKGGQQMLNIGSTSWNRGTLCHELGHALGFVHEHQRSDRDSYVTILTQNANDGGANFVKLTDSTNKGAYDFYSVMHYARNAFSVNPTPANPNLPDASSDTIEPLAAYAQFLNVMGRETDRTLSKLDRAAVAQLYGAPSATPGLTVTNSKDGGPGSLRTAIYYAFDRSVDAAGSINTVVFHLPTTDAGYSGGVFTIPLTSQLTAPGDGTVIDGATQTAFTGDTNPSGPEIFLNGAGTLASEFLYAAGVKLRAANCSVKGLAIGNFNTQGVAIVGGTATGNAVQGCYIGTNPAGTTAAPNAFAGIEIYNGAHGNMVGGTTAATRNVVSGNTSQGIYLHDAMTTGNIIQGNYLGTNAAGTAALANAFSGIELGVGAQNNGVGGTMAGAGNLISGNKYQGIYLHDSATTGNSISGNFIGTNASGAAAVGNGFADPTNHVFASGVEITGAGSNTIGGTVSTARNVISGNAAVGVAVSGATATANTVAGNTIGLNAAGTAAVANGAADPANSYNYPGVEIYGAATNNVIGGTVTGAGNLISGNAAQGVILADAGTSGNVVAGNLIGLNAAGATAVANGYSGVSIFGSATANTIGGTMSAARNIISGNGTQGITISDAGTSGNVVAGNYIGVNASGAAAVANGYAGVAIFGSATGNTIGGTVATARNVISGNGNQGITVSDTNTNANVVAGNYIGLDATGLVKVANTYGGVEIFGGAQSNQVGGTAPGARNFIAGNTNYGVAFSGSGTNLNAIQGNTIGLNFNGVAVSNGYQGVAIFGGAQSNRVGGTTAGAGNLISGNTAAGGVAFYDSTSLYNSLNENSIYANGGSELSLFNGANGSLAAPVLSQAVLGLNTTVSGTLNTGVANTAYRVEFFATPAAGTGGKVYVGSTNVMTNSAGNATLSLVALAPLVPAGSLLVATATNPAGSTSAFSATRAVITNDTDGDGIPDVYENAHGLNPNSAADAALDSDGDGLTNLQEYRAGTDPKDARSQLKIIAVTRTNNDLILSFPSTANMFYRLESMTDLTSAGTWRLQTDAILGTGSTVQLTLPGAVADPKRFYRIVAEP